LFLLVKTGTGCLQNSNDEGDSLMNIAGQFLDHFDAVFALKLGLDLFGMSVLIFGLYYRRYHDKELVTAAALFNIFIFSVLATLSAVNFGVAAGFGLFAILALFTLRSEPLSKIEMTYFFGSVAVAVICSVQGNSPQFAVMIIGLVLTGTYVIDHPKMLRSISGAKVTLDKIDKSLFSDATAMRKALSQQMDVEVLSFQVLQIDYINELVRLNVYFRIPQSPAHKKLPANQPQGAQLQSRHAAQARQQVYR
jgi:Domain of unknown function (DUF4956)